MLGIATPVILITITLVMYFTRKNSKSDVPVEEKMTIERLLDIVKREMADIRKEENFFGKDDFEWEALYNRKRRIQKADDNCVFGIDSDKIIIKDLIVSILAGVLKDEDAIREVVDFGSPFLDVMVKFEIIMHYLKKTHGKNALTYIIRNYHLDRLRYDIEDKKTPHYCIDSTDIDRIYDDVITEDIPYTAQLEIVATLVYQKYKGYGCIDTLDEMYIDGYNCGTSGSVMSDILDRDSRVTRAPRSVWLYFEGKYIHAKFLTFYTEAELRRVVQLLARYNSPGPLTKKRGYLVTTKWNKSRVLAVCPEASEYWAVFVRNFSLSSQTLETLVNPNARDPVTGQPILEEKPMSVAERRLTKCELEMLGRAYDFDKKIWLIPKKKYKNAEVPMEVLKYLMKGKVTSAFTGRQGCGKTTMMTAAIQPVDARYNIRVIEMAPELYLRELYPDRNILSFSETPTVAAEALLDASKKSDAALTIVGEVATDQIATRMLQSIQVSSIFGIFSHHAVRAADLVNALTNSIVACSGGAATPTTVMPQVVEAIHIDVHLDYDTMGNRYIDRITEIVRLDSVPYPDKLPKETTQEYQTRILKEYATRVTDRKMFDTVDILHFNKETFTYETDNFFSAELTDRILSQIPREEISQFKEFALKNWR